MAEKDVASKVLEAKNDVFADIMNACLFNGKQIAKPDELEDLHPVSAYEAGGKLRSMERDVSKIWKQGAINIACIGVENQSAKDNAMPLRVLAYDGAEYRRQISEKVKEFYPVVTLVLYFGKEPWKKPDCLLDVVKVPQSLKPFVSDYKINVIDVSHMTLEQAKLFKSDFYVIADYFAQVNAYGDYEPHHDWNMTHPLETFRFMRYLTGNKKYEDLVAMEEGGPTNMYDALQVVSDKAEARGKDSMSNLFKKLFALGRIDDAKRVAEDAEYRDQLMREFAIQ